MDNKGKIMYKVVVELMAQSHQTFPSKETYWVHNVEYDGLGNVLNLVVSTTEGSRQTIHFPLERVAKWQVIEGTPP